MMKVWYQCYFVKNANVPCILKWGVAALELFEYGLPDNSHLAGGAVEYSGICPEWMKGTPWGYFRVRDVNAQAVLQSRGVKDQTADIFSWYGSTSA